MRHRFLRSISALFFALLSNQTTASENLALTHAEMLQIQKEETQFRVEETHRDPLYRLTMEHCHGYASAPDEYFWASLDQMATLLTIDFSALVDLYYDRGLSPELAHTLKSDVFFAALQDCYPNDDVSQGKYILRLIVADFSARALAVGLVGFSRLRLAPLFVKFPILYKAVSVLFVGRASYTATKMGLLWYQEKDKYNRNSASQTLQQRTTHQNQQVMTLHAQTLQSYDLEIERVRSTLRSRKLTSLERRDLIKRLKVLELDRKALQSLSVR